MFGATRVLWIVNKHLSAVLYAHGERDRTISGTITAKEVLGYGELSFLDEVHIYRRRSKKDAAYMVLVETASAWFVAGNESYANYALQAARRLLYIFHAEDNPEQKMLEYFDRRVAERIAERTRHESFHSGIADD